ncbi:hypothetical protein PR202_ga16575 [Eleusine coracana subsp. coracana]|uniref:non-specific serine/threonine protein kinase n=1 Tax=Eleusine coracana subsp. coracana TaxID=191504 RepID=A0AAV5CN08_ELECO|nr:hypothetical protein PR202_ga16575 [Eleusine coracana subsp. coracana]
MLARLRAGFLLPVKLNSVWVANRPEAPIRTTGNNNSASSSAPTLAVTNTSNLVLSDGNGRIVLAAANVATGEHSWGIGTTATLANAGNLVLRSLNGAMLWQSFDHSRDTFLPGRRLRTNNATPSCRGRVPGTLRRPGASPTARTRPCSSRSSSGTGHARYVAQRRVDGQQGPPDPSSTSP